MIQWAWGKCMVASGAIAIAAASVFMPAATSVARGATVVNDTWLDGSDSDPAAPVYSETGVDGDVDGDIESVWFQGGGGTLDPVGPGGPLRGALAATGSSSWTTYFTPEAAPVTLQQGDSLNVRWAFSVTGLNTGNTSQDFRIAVVNSPEASRLAANGSPGNSTYTGYALFSNMAPTFANSNPFQLREHDGDGALLSASGDWLALANGFANGGTGYADGVPYTLDMQFTRTLADALDITVSVTGGNLNGTGSASVSFSDATPSTFTFDTFAVRPSSAGGTASTFDTTLFRVEHNQIPEPASLALLGLGGLAMLRRRQRHG